jgi:hypothetical protein
LGDQVNESSEEVSFSDWAHDAPGAEALDVLERYAERLKREQDALAVVMRRMQRLSVARLTVFTAMTALASYAAFANGGAVAWVAALVLLGTFIALVLVHNREKERARLRGASVALFEMRLASAQGDWPGLPAVAVPARALPHWAVELDVVGSVSLLRLLCGAATLPGRRTIEEWIFAAAKADEVLRRQQAVQELLQRMELVEGIQTRALLAPQWSNRAFVPFVEWCENQTDILSRSLLWWCRAVSTTVVVTLILYGAGLVAARIPLIAIITSVTTLGVVGRRAARAIGAVQGREAPLESLSGMLQLVEEAGLRSFKFVELHEALISDRLSASGALRKLSRMTETGGIRESPMMYAVLQLLLMWDVHLLAAIENWRRLHGSHARRWLDALGETEALCALANLGHANPDWCFPTVSDGAGQNAPREVFDAKDLAHPLIPRGTRVANDVRVGPPGTFLLVTGSNMSGKSTLLRAIGLNTVLAQAGAPACASSLTMPPIVLTTSVQVQDSLAQGVSRFMAELLRLREVVDVASHQNAAALPLYLLDEILQGTNSAERQVGARMVLTRLVGSHCIGVVTTHDLALADSPALLSAAHMVHFTEGVEDSDGRISLSFEYKLRDGIATATNALRLMRAVGLAE